MFDMNTILLFCTASVLLALAPGPDNIYVLTQSMLKGRAVGIMITLGLCTGLIVHTAAVVFGVAVLLKTSVVAFTILKIAGALYLLYLAWKAFSAPAGEVEVDKSAAMTPWRFYLRGIIMNASNPKVSIFFLAFLPQFANPSRGSMTLQLVLLAAMFLLSALVVFSLISYLAAFIGSWFMKSKRVKKVLNRLAGSIFAILAVKLALARQ